LAVLASELSGTAYTAKNICNVQITPATKELFDTHIKDANKRMKELTSKIDEIISSNIA
jgi:hypothetical protein